MLEKRNPGLVQLEEIGRSYEGRPLIVIKIGEESPAEKPAVWIDAGIHAREWIAPATAVYIIWALVSGYRSDNTVTSLLSKYDWFILPVVNPDGYEFSNTTDRMWRKTRSRISHGNRRNCVGVDGNRNFDFNWQGECNGRSASCRGRHPCESVFAGRIPFSEPETIAIANFILQHRSTLKLYIALHSYSQLWLTPWGYTTERPDDYVDLIRVANRATSVLQSYHRTQYEAGSPAIILYSATGGAYDWAKGVAGIKYSYTIELRDRGDFGFLLPHSQIVPTGEETFAALLAAVDEIDHDTCWVYGTHCNTSSSLVRQR
jgi:murein tripeptide amidase MpaA